jgi:HPt (histidine-containing phosphotransfer) domain-containing protein
MTSLNSSSEPLPSIRATDRASLPIFEREQLIARCMGSIELVEKLIKRFDERFETDAREIERSIRSSDASSAARLAHRLKGAAANISAPALQASLQRVENCARAGDLKQACESLFDLSYEWCRFVKYKAQGELSRSDAGSPAAHRDVPRATTRGTTCEC